MASAPSGPAAGSVTADDLADEWHSTLASPSEAGSPLDSALPCLDRQQAICDVDSPRAMPGVGGGGVGWLVGLAEGRLEGWLAPASPASAEPPKAACA